MKATLLWTGFAAYLAWIFLKSTLSPRGCGPPTVEQAIHGNEVTLQAITSLHYTGSSFGPGSLEEQERELEGRLGHISDRIFNYHAQLQLELYPDGLLEIWLEYPPNEWLEGQDLDFRLVWEVDVSQGRILTEPTPFE